MAGIFKESVLTISIHALREEGDAVRRSMSAFTMYFYPRPPRGGRRAGSVRGMAVNLFLSTPSARRATWGADSDSGRTGFLSTPSARRATPGCHDQCERYAEFLSTPSARRATRSIGNREAQSIISIHALREEGDDRRSSTE